MKRIIHHFSTVFAIIILLNFMVGCRNSNNEKTGNELNIDHFADSIWQEFAKAIENRDIETLLENSFDTIQCIDCIQPKENESEYYNSEMIFNYYLNELRHLDSLLNKDYSVYRDDSIIRVSYTIKWKPAPEGAYNVVFSFQKKQEKYYFDGMFTIP